MAHDSAAVLENLHAIIGHVRDNTGALERLLDLFQKTGEKTHVGEVTELLAHAYVQSGKLVRARDLYQTLAAMEPQNLLHMRNYQQVVAMMGGSGGERLITAEEGAVMIDELEATAPIIEQQYPDKVAIAIRSALTDKESDRANLSLLSLDQRTARTDNGCRAGRARLPGGTAPRRRAGP